MALWLILAAAAVTAVAVYALSLRLRPWWPCRACHGTGKTTDRIWRRATGTCARCAGKGRHPRLGIRVLQPARARAMTAAKGAHKTIDRRKR
ncbi:MAG TPA: hypothetical protein VGF32_23355 [Streptosporangiaceae bacterium]|jgi:DnaJ-class molecular chaperone